MIRSRLRTLVFTSTIALTKCILIFVWQSVSTWPVLEVPMSMTTFGMPMAMVKNGRACSDMKTKAREVCQKGYRIQHRSRRQRLQSTGDVIRYLIAFLFEVTVNKSNSLQLIFGFKRDKQTAACFQNGAALDGFSNEQHDCWPAVCSAPRAIARGCDIY